MYGLIQRGHMRSRWCGRWGCAKWWLRDNLRNRDGGTGNVTWDKITIVCWIVWHIIVICLNISLLSLIVIHTDVWYPISFLVSYFSLYFTLFLGAYCLFLFIYNLKCWHISLSFYHAFLYLCDHVFLYFLTAHYCLCSIQVSLNACSDSWLDTLFMDLLKKLIDLWILSVLKIYKNIVCKRIQYLQHLLDFSLMFDMVIYFFLSFW